MKPDFTPYIQYNYWVAAYCTERRYSRTFISIFVHNDEVKGGIIAARNHPGEKKKKKKNSATIKQYQFHHNREAFLPPPENESEVVARERQDNMKEQKPLAIAETQG